MQVEIPLDLEPAKRFTKLPGAIWNAIYGGPKGKKQDVFCNSSQSDVEQFVLVDEAINSISSRFSKITSRFKKVEGYKTGLHSFRGHFATALEEVGCPEQLAAHLAGHKRLSLTYNLYSKYQNKEEMWSYIERIHETESFRTFH